MHRVSSVPKLLIQFFFFFLAAILVEVRTGLFAAVVDALVAIVRVNLRLVSKLVLS